MSAVCIIPARGGSRRIPRKNVRHFNGKPLLAHSIEIAKAAGIFDLIAVSTDDPEIGAIATECGAAWMYRPSAYASDEVGTQEVMRHTLQTLEDGKLDGMAYREPFAFACCLYATAPMLRPQTLRDALALAKANPAGYVIPVGNWLRDPGQFYMGRANLFLGDVPLNASGTQLIAIDPRTDCDINTEDDFLRAERMYADLMGDK